MMRLLLALVFGLWASAASAQSTQCVSSAVAGGTADAITVPLLPCSPTANLLILTLTATNTISAPTLKILGSTIPAAVVQNSDGTSVGVGGLAAGNRILLTYNGTTWNLLSTGAGAFLLRGNNLSDLTSDPTAVSNLGLGLGSPLVADRATLAASSTASFPNGVWRKDYSAGLGAPPLFYAAGTVPCTLNAGAGDGGTQVPSADGKCWLAPIGISMDVRQFGAVCNAVNSNDTAAFQAAQKASDAGIIPKIMVPPGCRVNATIAFTKAATLAAYGGPYDDAVAGQAPGTAAGGTVLTYTGVAAVPVITFKSATANNELFGLAIEGLTVDCGNVATFGYQLSTVGLAKINAGAIRCVTAGMQIDDLNGDISELLDIERFWYRSGANAAAASSHGLSLFGPTHGVTESHIKSLFISVNNGDALRLNDVDGVQIDYVFGFALGTGNVIHFTNASRSNSINYVGAGQVTLDAGTYGNTIFANVENASTPYVDNASGNNNLCWTLMASPQARNCKGPGFSYVPTITCGAGAVGAYSKQLGTYRVDGFGAKTVSFNIKAAIGTCAGTVAVSLPMQASATLRQNLTTMDATAASPLISGFIEAGASAVTLFTAAGNPTGSDEFIGTGTYQ